MPSRKPGFNSRSPHHRSSTIAGIDSDRSRACSSYGRAPAFQAGYCGFEARHALSGRGAVWLARSVRDRKVGGSNPLAPTPGSSGWVAQPGRGTRPRPVNVWVQIPPQPPLALLARGAEQAPEALSAMHWSRKPGSPVQVRTGARRRSRPRSIAAMHRPCTSGSSVRFRARARWIASPSGVAQQAERLAVNQRRLWVRLPPPELRPRRPTGTSAGSQSAEEGSTPSGATTISTT
jgi:hypothetical protein